MGPLATLTQDRCRCRCRCRCIMYVGQLDTLAQARVVYSVGRSILYAICFSVSDNENHDIFLNCVSFIQNVSLHIQNC